MLIMRGNRTDIFDFRDDGQPVSLLWIIRNGEGYGIVADFRHRRYLLQSHRTLEEAKDALGRIYGTMVAAGPQEGEGRESDG